VAEFINSLSPIGMSSRSKINKETSELIDIISQMDLTDIYRIFQKSASQHIFFSEAYGILSKVDHIL
jgi:hypothetical protein